MWAASPARNTRPCQYCDTCPWWISKHVSQWLRVMLGAWADDEIGWGNHHMGTTRMGHDPKQSVVDANGRVHGIGNLLIAGSSVFPSCGPVNPTFTIVALAIRMADHIKGGSLG